MINKVIIVGRLGTDPEMRFTPSGTAVTSFTVATSETRNTEEGRKEVTEWHRVVTFNKTAENCNTYLEKGKLVYVEGKLHYRTWEGEDGSKKKATDITANIVKFLSPSGNGGGHHAADDYGNIEPEELPY